MKTLVCYCVSIFPFRNPLKFSTFLLASEPSILTSTSADDCTPGSSNFLQLLQYTSILTSLFLLNPKCLAAALPYMSQALATAPAPAISPTNSNGTSTTPRSRSRFRSRPRPRPRPRPVLYRPEELLSIDRFDTTSMSMPSQPSPPR